ncbi:MAG TPA: DUF4012 domain-containing protein [Acidimicrobiales bacterium]|nr:DUF4012 domain-containing protein [Acidimicrobiales bacterium]
MIRRLLLVAALLVAVWAGYVAVVVAGAASDLRAGRDAASAAREQLGAEEVADGAPLADLREAAARFGDADDAVSSPLLAPLKILPVLGRQLRSVDALASAASGVADTGVDAIERAQVVFDDPAGGGEARLAQVVALQGIVTDVAERLVAIDDLGPVQGLVGPLADARNELAADLLDARRSLEDARIGADAVVSLVAGPRRYLVVAANNAEMRAGSGMWLQGGVLETNRGELRLGDMRPLHLDVDPPDDAVTLTGDFASRWGFLNPQREWRNLMASPRFPQSAELATRMWQAATGETVDGVLAVDAIGLQALIEATGPVTVGDREIGADEVPQELLHDQYLRFGVLGGADSQENAERRETLAAIATAAVDRVDAGGWETSTMLRSLSEAVRGRHLLGWTPDPVEQAGWEAAGMAGELRPDSLLVSVLNRGGNKLDWFLDVDASLQVVDGRDGWDVVVEITLANRTPAGEPRYVAGPYPGLDLSPGEYRGILAVNVPRDASGARFDDVPSLAVAGSDGPTRVVGFQLDLPAGETVTRVLRFTLPQHAGAMRVEPSARVPGITWRYGAEEWEDSESRVANW